MKQQVKIIEYNPDQAERFDPKANIIDKDGIILYAEYQGELIGTAALLKHDNGKWYELSKMGVLEKSRGLNAGRLVFDAALEKCRELGAEKIYLETSTKCIAAVKMYYKAGFVEVPVRDDCEYDRSDLAMELVLK